ncbi:MAG TPA: HAMP domain-containing sensor histidine kinase [Ktedonobacterales bacterium]
MTRVRQRLLTWVSGLSLRWRLSLLSLGLFAVLLGSVMMVLTVAEREVLLRNEALGLRGNAAAALETGDPVTLFPVARGSVPPPIGPATDGVTRVAQHIGQLKSVGVHIALLSPTGTVLASSPLGQARADGGKLGIIVARPQPAAVPASLMRNALTSAAERVPYSVLSGADGSSQLVVLVPLQQDSHTVAVLQLNASTAPIDLTVGTTRLIMLAGLLVALVVAIALTRQLFTAALRPLSEMERASERIAEGDLTLRLAEPPSHDEIGRLARSFNSMVSQLEASFARQERFVADVSHELRTPLTALGGSLEMLMLGADAGDPGTRQRLLRTMYAETSRMNRLVRDLLTLSRLDEGTVALQLSSVALGPLCAEVLDQVRPLAEARVLIAQVTPASLAVRADGDRLRQVLLNLLDNAIRATAPDGHITLDAAAMADKPGIILRVTDDGAGIPAEALPHVFERFYRADESRSRDPGRNSGSGLGLSICRGLIEAHGGTITASSGPDAGTTISILLPQ